jgi:CRP-like cAMP-binding protein
MKRIPLEETALLRALDPERRQRIGQHLLTRQFEEGEYLYHASQAAEYLWFVGSGVVRTLRGSASGRVTTLESLHPGDLFGLAAMSEGARYAETAQGLVAGQVWFLPRRSVASLVETDPALGRTLLSIIAERLQGAHDRLCTFAHHSVTERMAAALLEADDGERIDTTRRILGEAAGTTVETAIRVLRRFEQAGWIEGGVGWIRVLDRDALRRASTGDNGKG